MIAAADVHRFGDDDSACADGVFFCRNQFCALAFLPQPRELCGVVVLVFPTSLVCASFLSSFFSALVRLGRYHWFFIAGHLFHLYTGSLRGNSDGGGGISGHPLAFDAPGVGVGPPLLGRCPGETNSARWHTFSVVPVMTEKVLTWRRYFSATTKQPRHHCDGGVVSDVRPVSPRDRARRAALHPR